MQLFLRSRSVIGLKNGNKMCQICFELATSWLNFHRELEAFYYIREDNEI
jgi:hypothetical protein